MKHTSSLVAPVVAMLAGLIAADAVAQAPVEQRAPVYSGGTPAGTGMPATSMAPAPVSAAVTPAADAQARLDALEEEMRQLRGQVEEQGFTMEQLRRQLATQSPPATAPQAAAPQTLTPPSSAPVAAPPAITGSASLGTAPQPAPAAPVPPTPTPGATLPGSAATDSYSQAFTLLQQGNYPAAEQGFVAFLAAKPGDPLAGNAQYWLAETFYVRKDYGRAAQEFLKGYQTYPTGSKAPDSLLKLALSLSALGQKDQACRTFAQLNQDYPALSRTLADRAAQERQRLACP